MELADVTDSKSVGATRAGSSPATGTIANDRLSALQVVYHRIKHLISRLNVLFYDRANPIIEKDVRHLG